MSTVQGSSLTTTKQKVIKTVILVYVVIKGFSNYFQIKLSTTDPSELVPYYVVSRNALNQNSTTKPTHLVDKWWRSRFRVEQEYPKFHYEIDPNP